MSGGLVVFGLDMKNVKKRVGLGVLKSVLNINIKMGKLGRLQNLSLEMNHLNLV